MGPSVTSTGALLLLSSPLFFSSIAHAQNQKLPVKVTEFPLTHAAVATFDATTFPGADQNGPGLLLTTFYPAGKDGVYAVSNVRDLLAGGDVNMTAIDPNAMWPNQATPVPANTVSDNGNYVLTAGGFFVSPQKSTGEIALIDIKNLYQTDPIVKTTISTPKKGNFYHQAEWADISGDGKANDIIAARAFKSSFNPLSKPQGELVWLQPPSGPAPSGPWTEQELTNETGPGVGFTLTDLDGDGKFEVVAAQFFAAQQLSLWWCDAPHWSGCVGGANVQTSIIDNSESAPFFAVEWVDLNGDGKKELLATTNTASGKGGVFVYEPTIPAGGSIGDITWTKHQIADGYKPKKAFLPGRGSPGKATAFKIHDSDKANAILVCADDGGFVDLLVPSNQSSWEYTKYHIVNSTDTIGTPSIMDVDGDGFAEFAVPLFAENKVALYTFGPLGKYQKK